MLLSFLAGINTILFMAVVAIFIIILVVLFFLKEGRLHFIIAAFLLFLFTISAMVNLSAAKKIDYYKDKTEKITAVITKAPTFNGTTYSYEAKLKTIDNNKIRFTKIRINSYKNEFEAGDEIEAKVDFFDFENKNSIYAENIYMGSSLKAVIRIKSNHNGLRYKIFKLQEYTKNTVANYLDGDIGQLIVAIITGDSRGLGDETYDLVKKSGVSHMIVVSGMHLSIVCTALMWIFGKTISNRYIQTFAMLIAIFFIMFFCGFTKSILRAGITYIILALAPLLKRDRDSLSALSFTVILTMLMSPFAFYSISFQLTLSSTFGILVLSPIISRNINNLLHTKNVKFIKNFIDIISVTIGANIMTLPIVLYVYEWVSAVSLLTNILINYTVSAMLIIGIIGAITGKITVISYPCFFFAGLLSKYSLWVIKWLGSMPLATVSFNGKPLAAIVCMIYLVIYIYFSLIQKGKSKNHLIKEPN